MSDKQDSVGDDRDELDFESTFSNGNIDPNVFSIRNALEQPDAKVYTTLELHIQIHNGKIDLCPPYQRDVVWPTGKQMEIIDSLFHNFYVPPVIFAVMRDEEGEEVRICVDGKQRLTSIVKFLDGHIAYKDPDTRKLWWYQVPALYQGKRNEISPEGKRKFEEKRITCVEYRALSPTFEREVFQRVQLGMSLSAAEKLQAIASPWADYVNELDVKYISISGGLAGHVDFDAKRGRTFQNLASMLYCCEDVDLRRTPSAVQLEKWLNGRKGPSRTFSSRMERALSSLLEIASDATLNKAFTGYTAKVSPAEFVFIGVLLYVMDDDDAGDFRDREKAAAILHFRYELRQAHKDVRLNSRICKDSWAIISAVDERKVNLSLSSMVQRVVPNGTVSSKATKRKKRVPTDDGSEGENIPSSLRISKAKKTKVTFMH
ncbi:hypothetical protein B0F90DRAFT_1074625 [Multifurca ochricompacta]|uniref:GmrSD restriction endonucleases N-terminal domain-containing protein n=1 Tax=Multifurca ochricompacta TaxID=376703 RepID=A0AAD4M836_9AGAM|nr:hypothetical protein B0F90DRAFT_1074625 [Multifurca ochricompacta]